MTVDPLGVREWSRSVAGGRRVPVMTGDHQDLTPDDLISDRARLAQMRRSLGAHLADSRQAVGVSQTELAKALDRSPSMVSKVENGEKCLSAPLWKIADQVCAAQGALLAEYRKYAEAERDVRARWQNHNRQKQRPTRLARAAAARKARTADPTTGAICALLGDTGDGPAPQAVLIAGAQAQEMMAMFDSLVRAFGRRRAIQIFSVMMATVGLADLDADEKTRLAQAVDNPDRIDGEVVRTLWATLTQTRRLYDRPRPGAGARQLPGPTPTDPPPAAQRRGRAGAQTTARARQRPSGRRRPLPDQPAECTGRGPGLVHPRPQNRPRRRQHRTCRLRRLPEQLVSVASWRHQ
ncbi:MAG: helix-turn-helix domain-containing protein, partial [Pseudonocardiaceae bacterium]